MPGSFELPIMAKAMAKSGKYDGVVAIGTVVSICSFTPVETHFRASRNQAIHDAIIDYKDKLD